MLMLWGTDLGLGVHIRAVERKDAVEGDGGQGQGHLKVGEAQQGQRGGLQVQRRSFCHRSHHLLGPGLQALDDSWCC